MRPHHLGPHSPQIGFEGSRKPSSVLAGEKRLVKGWLQEGSTQARLQSS